MNIEERIKERNKRGRKPKRSLIIYIKVLAKEMFNNLRYSESLSLSILGIRIPKSTLNYWEVNYEFLIKEIKC
jgi:hypothetical protein